MTDRRFGEFSQDIAGKELKVPNLVLDAIDRKIIIELQSDGRMPVQQLAERVGLSPSPCARRIRMLERAGIIKGYVAVVDQGKVGLPINAFASIKLVRQQEDDLDSFAETVSRWPEVVDCYLMTGRQDYLMRIVIKDLEAYEAFLKEKLTRLTCVASIETSFALGQVKRSDHLPLIW
jgi:Lrp/AsnC family leucine-responsive transcriptional regulator